MEHDCDKTTLCTICFEYYDNQYKHFCPLEKQKKASGLPRPLATYDLETLVQQKSSNCNDCLVQEQVYLTKMKKLRSELKKQEKTNIYCAAHRNETERESFHECNLIATVFEDQYYGSFSMIVMADPALQYDQDLKLQKNYFETSKEEYYDPQLFGQPLNRKFKKMKKFHQRLSSSRNVFPIKIDENHDFEIGSDKPLTENDINFLKKLSPMEKFVAYFVNPRFSNQVFLVGFLHYTF